MPLSNMFIFLEGNSEYFYLKDYLENHGKLVFCDGEIQMDSLEEFEQKQKIINPNRFDVEYGDIMDEYDCVTLVCDNDDKVANNKIKDALSVSKRSDGAVLHVLKQSSNMEVFVASHFESFTMSKEDMESIEKMKYIANKFLIDLTHVSDIKKLKNKFTLS